MVKPEWGNKHICGNCAARFYDMKKEPPACPKCGTVQEISKKGGRKKAAPKPEEAEKVADVAPKAELDDEVEDEDLDDVLDEDDDEEDDDLLLDDDEDDSLIEDASDLGDEDDDLSEAKEHLEKEDI